MKVKITAGGIYNGLGREIPIGTILTVKNDPVGWAGRYEVVGDDAETDVDANHEDPNEAARLLIAAQNEKPAEPVKKTAAEKKAEAAAAAKAVEPDAAPVIPAPPADPAVPAPAPVVGLQPWQQS